MMLVLLALKDGAKHGYEISTHVKKKTDGYFSLSFGSLYPILHKLEKDGLVTAHWDDESSAKKKKIYKLTRRGHQALDEECAGYKAFSLAMLRLMEGMG